MRVLANRKRLRAQSIIETVVGIIFMIPIVLFLFDVGILILANTANDNLAKQAARAAAGAAPNPPLTQAEMQNVGLRNNKYRAEALKAAKQVITNYGAGRTSGYITQVQFSKMWYNGVQEAGTIAPPAGDVDPGPGNVAVFTSIRAQAPVPFPGFDTTKIFFAKAVEPIVSLPPE